MKRKYSKFSIFNELSSVCTNIFFLCYFLFAIFVFGYAEYSYGGNNFQRPQPNINNIWYDHNDSDTVFVFVHGVLSDSRDAWYYTDKSNSVNNRYWPELIRQDARFHNPSIFLAGFYTDFGSGEYNIRDAANEVYQALSVSLEPAKFPIISKPNILFITHSTGGIVVRHILTKHADKFVDKTIGLLLYASPSIGSRDANRLKWIADSARNKMGKQLQWNHPFLEELDKDFKNLIHHKKLPLLIGEEAIENHFVIKSLGFFDKKVVVESASGGRYFGEPIRLRNTTHFSIVKPDSHRHPAYLFLRNFYENKFVPQKSSLINGKVISEDETLELIRNLQSYDVQVALDELSSLYVSLLSFSISQYTVPYFYDGNRSNMVYQELAYEKMNQMSEYLEWYYSKNIRTLSSYFKKIRSCIVGGKCNEEVIKQEFCKKFEPLQKANEKIWKIREIALDTFSVITNFGYDTKLINNQDIKYFIDYCPQTTSTELIIHHQGRRPDQLIDDFEKEQGKKIEYCWSQEVKRLGSFVRWKGYRCCSRGERTTKRQGFNAGGYTSNCEEFMSMFTD